MYTSLSVGQAFQPDRNSPKPWRQVSLERLTYVDAMQTIDRHPDRASCASSPQRGRGGRKAAPALLRRLAEIGVAEAVPEDVEVGLAMGRRMLDRLGRGDSDLAARIAQFRIAHEAFSEPTRIGERISKD